MSETTQSAAPVAGDSDMSVRITRRIRATPEELFDAWTNPESVRVWMCPGDVKESRAQLDPRVGGKFQIDMVAPKATVALAGEYLVVDRPRKLSFTWVSMHTSQQPTVVTIDLKPVGADETELTLTHTGFQSADSAKGHRVGWGTIIEKLAANME